MFLWNSITFIYCIFRNLYHFLFVYDILFTERYGGRLMNLKDAQIILSLNETKNMTKTAEQLFITQPALSKRIQNIEAELGVPVLLRHQKGILFTPVGEQVVEYARTISSGMEALREYADASKNYISGTLEVGIAVNYAHYCLPQVLQKYVADFPHVSIQITTGLSQYLYQLLTSEQLPMAVVRGDYSWYEGKQLLSREPLYLVYHKKFSRKDLPSLPYINRHTDPSLTASIQQYLGEQNLIPAGKSIRIDDMDICHQMARKGFGWTILPSLVLKDTDCHLEPMILKDGTPISRDTHLLFRTPYQNLPQAKRFIEYLSSLVPDHTLERGSQVPGRP